MKCYIPPADSFTGQELEFLFTPEESPDPRLTTAAKLAAYIFAYVVFWILCRRVWENGVPNMKHALVTYRTNMSLGTGEGGLVVGDFRIALPEWLTLYRPLVDYYQCRFQRLTRVGA